MDGPTPTMAQALAEMWLNHAQVGSTTWLKVKREPFFRALQKAVHAWGLAENDYKSVQDGSAGLPLAPRELLQQALTLIREGAQRREYWVVRVQRRQVDQLLSVVSPQAHSADGLKSRSKYVFEHWRRRLRQPDPTPRPVEVWQGNVFEAHVLSFSDGRRLMIAAVLTLNDHPVLLDPDQKLTYVPLIQPIQPPSESPKIPNYELLTWRALAAMRADAGDERTAEEIRELARKIGIPSLATLLLRLKQFVASRRKRPAHGVIEIASQAVVSSTATGMIVQTDGVLALANSGGMVEPPSLGEALAEHSEHLETEARDGAERLLGYMDSLASEDRLDEQQRAFARQLEQVNSILGSLLDELTARGVIATADTWIVDARNEWLVEELSRERAAHLGQGAAPDVERAVRRTRTPRTPSLLEQRARVALARSGGGDGVIDALRSDIEAWLRMLDDRHLDPSVEKRIEQELFVRMKLWDASRGARSSVGAKEIAQPADSTSNACVEYLAKQESRLLAALYRAARLIRMSDGLPTVNKRWLKQRRAAPLVEERERAAESVSVSTIFAHAEEVAAWRYLTHPDLVVLQKMTEEYLYLRTRFRPMPYETQVLLAKELRVLSEVFHLALHSLREQSEADE